MHALWSVTEQLGVRGRRKLRTLTFASFTNVLMQGNDVVFFSRTPDQDFRSFYPCKIIIILNEPPHDLS